MILLVFFHDVDHLGVFKRRVEEEAGEPLLHDFNFQLGHLLGGVCDLPYLVFFVTGELTLHYDGYPAVLFDAVAVADRTFAPDAPWNNMFGDCFS